MTMESFMGRLERLLDKADILKETGKFNDALVELAKAMEIEPENPDVYLSYALTYDSMNDLKASLPYFEKALVLCPNDHYIMTHLGITLARNEKYSEAIEILNEALEINPEYIVAKWNLGLIYRTIGLYEDALKEFLECVVLDSESEYVKEEIHYQMGLCYYDMGWTREALNNFNNHLKLFPNDIWGHLSIGNCYFDLGWIEDSIRKFKDSLQICPDFIPAYNSLALSYAEKGWYEEALEVLRTALLIVPNDQSVKDNIDYIQSLKDDDDDGYKGIILFSIILKLLKKHQLQDNSN